MISIVNIDHIVLHTNHNTSCMLHFYCEVLGCKIERELGEFNLIQLRAGNAIIDLISPEERAITGGYNSHANVEHFCLTIHQAINSQLCEYFAKNAIEFSTINNNYGAQGMGASIYIKDPCQNIVELKQDKPR